MKNEIIELLEKRIKEAEFYLLNSLWLESLWSNKGINYVPDGDG